MISNLFIFTGAIQSGKTTTLFKLLTIAGGADGILQPLIDGYRCLYCIKDKRLLPLEVAEREQGTLQIGRYRFLRSSFDAANQYLCNIHSAEVVCIDEVGPLELQGEGIFAGLNGVIMHGTPNIRVIVVVRESLLSEVVGLLLSKYGIIPTIIRTEQELISGFSRKSNVK